VLTGQDSFSDGNARTFAATPQPFQFVVCAAGNPSPTCSVAPTTVPKAVDVITPPGVSQSTELDPTQRPLVVTGVPVPSSRSARCRGCGLVPHRNISGPSPTDWDQTAT
jgi:glucoamylase